MCEHTSSTLQIDSFASRSFVAKEQAVLQMSSGRVVCQEGQAQTLYGRGLDCKCYCAFLHLSLDRAIRCHIIFRIKRNLTYRKVMCYGCCLIE
jgi:hypothetical protein